MEGKYRGGNMREFTTLMTRLEIHFRRYSYFFTTEERKIAEGAAWLSDTSILKWAQHEKETGDETTWQEFYEFLLVNLLREAYQRYSDAKQTLEQSVREETLPLTSPNGKHTSPSLTLRDSGKNTFARVCYQKSAEKS
jgi:hypothetical protein